MIGTPTTLTEAVTSALDMVLRQKIKQRIERLVQPDIDAAVEEAMAMIKPTVEMFRDHAMQDTVVKVILEDRRAHRKEPK